MDTKVQGSPVTQFFTGVGQIAVAGTALVSGAITKSALGITSKVIGLSVDIGFISAGVYIVYIIEGGYKNIKEAIERGAPKLPPLSTVPMGVRLRPR